MGAGFFFGTRIIHTLYEAHTVGVYSAELGRKELNKAGVEHLAILPGEKLTSRIFAKGSGLSRGSTDTLQVLHAA